MDTETIVIVTRLCSLFFFGIGVFAFKSGQVTLGGGDSTGIDFKRRENPIGFYFTVLLYIFFGVISLFVSFKL